MTNGWKNRNLGELCTLISGRHLDPKQQNTESRGIGYLTGPADFGPLNPVISRWTEDPQALATQGDILITVKGAGVGKINLLDADSVAISRQLMAVRVTDGDPRFIFAFLSSQFEYFQSLGSGATVPGLSRDDVLDLQILMPPLAEQRRIVGILDEAFEGLATAKANAEQNLQNARALFESHLQAVFAKDYDNSELVTLSELATAITDGDHLPPPKSPTGVPFITIGNILKGTRKIDFTDTFMVPEAYFDSLKPIKKPKKGDVLYTVTGSFGIPVVLRDSVRFCFQRHIGLIRPKPEIRSDWLYYLLLSPQVFKQANEGATGTAQKTVSLKVLRCFKVPKVSLSIQTAAAAQLDSLTAETQRLESLYQRKLAALDELKKSLLQQAFNGELIKDN